jgi:hypothetical protein
VSAEVASVFVEIAKVSAVIVTMSAVIVNLQTEIASVETEITELQTEIANVETVIANQQTESAELSPRVAHLPAADATVATRVDTVFLKAAQSISVSSRRPPAIRTPVMAAPPDFANWACRRRYRRFIARTTRYQ